VYYVKANNTYKRTTTKKVATGALAAVARRVCHNNTLQEKLHRQAQAHHAQTISQKYKRVNHNNTRAHERMRQHTQACTYNVLSNSRLMQL